MISESGVARAAAITDPEHSPHLDKYGHWLIEAIEAIEESLARVREAKDNGTY